MLASSLQLAAQTKYKPASLVDLAGDTVSGYIDYRGWYLNPESVTFKKSLDLNDVEKLTPANTRWFSIEGQSSYASAEVSISLNTLELASLRVEMDTTKVTKQVFLKEIHRGQRLTLYSYQDQIKQRFYISNNSEGPVELIFGKTVRDLQEYRHDTYKQQLRTIAIEHNIFDANFDARIEGAEYSARDLTGIVQHMSGTRAQPTKARQGDGIRTGYQVSAGLTYNKLTYTGKSLITIDGLNSAGFDKYRDEVITNIISPLVSAGVDIYTNPVTRKWILRGEVSATRFESKTTSYSQYNDISPAGTENTYRLSGLSVSLTPHVLYHLYENRAVSCFVGAGASMTFLGISQNTAEEKRINQAATGVFVRDDYLLLKSSNLTAILRAGIQFYHRLEASVLWSNPTKYSTANSGGQSVKSRSIWFSIGYLMNRSKK